MVFKMVNILFSFGVLLACVFFCFIRCSKVKEIRIGQTETKGLQLTVFHF